MKKIARHALLLCAVALPTFASADEWVTAQGISYLCGGVGGASQAQMKSAESDADAQLVLTAGPDRSFLSDVKLTVASADKQHTASWQATGPICLLKLPQGNYTVEATYGDERRTAPIGTKAGKPQNTQPLIINFKPS